MPSLTALNITDFRNLHSIALNPGEHINLIHGENGSGKTSLLEAISVLAHGRSFRTHKYRRLINSDASETVLFTKLVTEPPVFEHHLGIKRSANGDVQIRLDGKTVNSSAELAQCLPVLVMNAQSFQLLEGSSRHRRQFLDWLVFHVKHDFKDSWKAYVRCVKHRNTLLRRGKISTNELAPWNKETAALGLKLEQMRAEVFDLLNTQFHRLVQPYGLDDKTRATLRLSYISGWKDEPAYINQLEQNYERDLKLGYTSIGSHRSDLKIELDKVPATEILSRGQQKSVILSLFLAEAEVFRTVGGRKPIFLLDDLPAELDTQNLGRIGKAIADMDSQVFVTAIKAEHISEPWQEFINNKMTMFHVKHGDIQQPSHQLSGD